MQAPVYGQCQQRLPLFLLGLLPLLSASAPSTVVTCSCASEGSHQLNQANKAVQYLLKFDTHAIQIGCTRPRDQEINVTVQLILQTNGQVSGTDLKLLPSFQLNASVIITHVY